jgi:branched-chain amino acid transport system ATP-binding protein
MPDAALQIEGLSARYGEAQALRDVSLQVGRGEVVTLVGRNGAGKTTLLRCVMGLHRWQGGAIRLNGRDISDLPPYTRARAGLAYVPDDRGIYATLAVEENLTLPPVAANTRWPLSRIYETFPVLRERRAHPGTKLSGGEQQMLAIARALRTGASVMLLDEPTEGLAPVLVQRVAAMLQEAKREGTTVLLVEQNLRFATTVADRHYLLAQGQIVEALANEEVMAREPELLRHLGV